MRKKKRRYEYLGFIASRTSFTLSIWGLMYFIINIKDNVLWVFDVESFILHEDNEYRYKYISFYNNYLENKKSIEWLYKFIYKKLNILFDIILVILIYFSKNLHIYANFLLGKNKKLNWKELLWSISFFLIFYVISIIIGVPRLYIIWIFFGLWELKDILTFRYESQKERYVYGTLNIYKKIKYIMLYDWSYSFYYSYRNKYDHLKKIYEDIYDKFFLFDLIKFIGNKYQDGYYSAVWMLIPHRFIKFPIIKIYKFYSWEVLIKGYIESIADVTEYTSDEIQINDAKKWINLINGDINIIYMIYPEKDPILINNYLNHNKIFLN
jgi:hypothetical protein